MRDASAASILPRPFFFLRHGEAEGNVERLCLGQLDHPLTERGRRQAEAARASCARLGISAIFHSPLRRAAETAAIVAASRAPLSSEPGLMEACLGVKQGAREDNAADPFLRQWIEGQTIDGAESYADFRHRVVAAANRCLDASPHGPPLLVAHAGTYHALREALGAPAGRVLHCVPYGHRPLGEDWRIEVVL